MTETTTILLVDDDDVEIMAVTRSLRKSGIRSRIEIANNGAEALKRLRATGDDRIVDPYIVLLDINMPEMNGHKFLSEIRRDPVLQQTVVFVLSTSSSPADIDRAYQRNVAGYVVKTDIVPGSEQLTELIRSFTSTVRLPKVAH